MAADAARSPTHKRAVPLNKMEKQGGLVVLGIAAFQEIQNGALKAAALALITMLSVAVYKSKDIPFPLEVDDTPIADGPEEVPNQKEGEAPQPETVEEAPPQAVASRALPDTVAAPPPPAPAAPVETKAPVDDMDEL